MTKKNDDYNYKQKTKQKQNKKNISNWRDLNMIGLPFLLRNS